MLDFQPKKPVRNWTSRREQRRLLMLFALAGGVLILFGIAREPRLYVWFTTIGEKPQPAADARVDTRPKPSTAARDMSAGLFAVSADASPDAANADSGGEAGPASAAGRFPDVQMEYFRAIKDSTMWRSSETEAWYHLLAIADKATQEEIERASRGRVTFLQLFRQPDIYRAELVTIAGTVHRVVPQEITPNYEDLSGEYYQVWLQPENSAHPVVAYVLSLPEGFPVEMQMSEPAEVTGFFFKVWAYAAKDEPRTAPILLAKTLRWKEERVRRTFERPAAIPKERTKPKAPPTKSPREYVAENWNFTDDVWQRFVDGEAVPAASSQRDDEAGTLLIMLNNLPRLAKDSVAAWTQEESALAAAFEQPPRHRGEIYRIEGRAVRCERVAMPAELAEFFDFAAVWRTEILPDDGGPVRVVYSSAAPRGWLRGADGKSMDSAALDERTAAVAMFVKRGAEWTGSDEVDGDEADGDEVQKSRPSLVFVAGRLAWWPVSILGQLGVDMALFDDVVQGVEIGGGEAECLYSMLEAAPRIDGEELERVARAYQFGLQKDFPYEYRDPGDPSNSFVLNAVRSRPERSAGVTATLSATALQAFRVQMNGEDAAKYGFDHYYQINASVPLEPTIKVVQQRKAVADGGGDANEAAAAEQTEELRKDMSVVFCVRRLPAGFPEGEKISESIRVHGFFFKTWAAASAKSVEKNPRVRQPYPMFIADSFVWYGEGETPSWIGAAIVSVLVGMLVLGGIGALVNRRGNRDLDKTLVRQRTETDEPLDELQVPQREPPDFGYLERGDYVSSGGEAKPAEWASGDDSAGGVSAGGTPTGGALPGSTETPS
jgi:hypothetical protein